MIGPGTLLEILEINRQIVCLLCQFQCMLRFVENGIIIYKLKCKAITEILEFQGPLEDTQRGRQGRT